VLTDVIRMFRQILSRFGVLFKDPVRLVIRPQIPTRFHSFIFQTRLAGFLIIIPLFLCFFLSSVLRTRTRQGFMGYNACRLENGDLTQEILNGAISFPGPASFFPAGAFFFNESKVPCQNKAAPSLPYMVGCPSPRSISLTFFLRTPAPLRVFLSFDSLVRF